MKKLKLKMVYSNCYRVNDWMVDKEGKNFTVYNGKDKNYYTIRKSLTECNEYINEIENNNVIENKHYYL